MGQVIQILTGGDDNYAYIVGNSEGVALIDPAFGKETIEEHLARAPGPLKYVVNTHSHYDHIALDDYFQKRYGVPAVIHEQGAEGISEPKITVKDGDEISLGQETIRIIHTPGHTRDSVVLVYCQYLFTGDTLFVDEDCGKVGYSGGVDDMFLSLQKIKALPGEMVVYSGHKYGKMDSATLEHEKKHNPALLMETLQELKKFKGM